MKTNAVRALEALDIAYSLRHYEVDPEDLTAVSVAIKIGLPVEQVFKTLLCAIDPPARTYTYVFAIIPGNAELDLKKLAAAAGVRRVELAPLKDVQPLTGYVRGGVTVLGAKKAFPAYVDETIELFDQVSVSAGVRGTQMVLSPIGYLTSTCAVLAALTRG